MVFFPSLAPNPGIKPARWWPSPAFGHGHRVSGDSFRPSCLFSRLGLLPLLRPWSWVSRPCFGSPGSRRPRPSSSHPFRCGPSGSCTRCSRASPPGERPGVVPAFYVMAPLSLGSSCAPEALSYAGGQIAQFIVKGRARMPDLEVHLWELLKPFIILGWCQWIGAAIFIWGSLHQLRCHAILGSLRENKVADEYVIPHGDWFEYVSCPHYLAEIVIYAGILVAAGGLDITVWLLFLFVVSNLVFAAAETHRWYRHKFESYPQSRRAIIPFIY